MLWQEQTWPTINSVDRNTPVLIPLGSCEQHGHHLPVFVDTIQVDQIARRAEQRLSDRILLAPTLWLGSSHHHKDFPGTITVLPLLYAQIIKSVALSMLNVGFRRLFFLNGHGGNRDPAAAALSDLIGENDLADDAYLALTSWWEIGRETLKPGFHGLETPALSHACEYETSLMLALRPDLVHLDRAKEGTPVLDNTWTRTENTPNQRVAIFRRFHRQTAGGSFGRPSVASESKGKSILDEVVQTVVAFAEDFARWPELPKRGPK